MHQPSLLFLQYIYRIDASHLQEEIWHYLIGIFCMHALIAEIFRIQLVELIGNSLRNRGGNLTLNDMFHLVQSCLRWANVWSQDFWQIPSNLPCLKLISFLNWALLRRIVNFVKPAEILKTLSGNSIFQTKFILHIFLLLKIFVDFEFLKIPAARQIFFEVPNLKEQTFKIRF